MNWESECVFIYKHNENNATIVSTITVAVLSSAPIFKYWLSKMVGGMNEHATTSYSPPPGGDGRSSVDHRQNNNSSNYLKANENMFTSPLPRPVRGTNHVTAWHFSFAVSTSSYLELWKCLASLASPIHTCTYASLMSCTGPLVTKEMTAGVITGIWDSDQWKMIRGKEETFSFF